MRLDLTVLIGTIYSTISSILRASRAGGFRCVSEVFVATCTGKLAATEDKMHIFTILIHIYSSPNPHFPAQQPEAP